MEIPGRIHNGVVVLEGALTLPEGAAVTVRYMPPAATPGKRVSFPLVHSAQPGSVRLTNERIAEILDEEDAAPRC